MNPEVSRLLATILEHIDVPKSYYEKAAERHRSLGERQPERNGFRLAVAFAEQLRFQDIEMGELILRCERRMIGDVVGGAHEIVECHDHRPVTRVDDP